MPRDWLAFSLLVPIGAVDLHFESPDSGFFLRPESSSSNRAGNRAGYGEILEGLSGTGGVLDVERFTVLDASRPALIRATYGPFSTKQTVPARYVLPQFPDEENITLTPGAFTSPQLEISAHLVVSKVTRARPSVRVLLHGAGARGHHSPHVCVTVVVRKSDQRISASCTPVGAGETGGDATCLVTLRVPMAWWPPHTRSTIKIPRTTVDVSYLVGTAEGPEQCATFANDNDETSVLGIGPRVTVQPETPVGEVLLGLEESGYEEVSKDPLVHVLVPRAPLHPGNSFYAPVYLHPPGNLPALTLVMKCRVRGGLRLGGVEASSGAWNVTVEMQGGKKNKATVTAMLANPLPDNETLHSLGLHEVAAWVMEVPKDAPAGEARITWAVKYVMDAHGQETFPEGNTRRVAAKLVILKDDIQAVLPIAKSWSIVNTAVLTGRQVSRAMKVLVVSQAGKVADVTLQSSCSCTDEAALKVSASCTSVYLDGSEVLGSHNATVVARYGQRTGSAAFTVWMPELPLLLHVDNAKLSQIRGWKAPLTYPPGHPFVTKPIEGNEVTMPEDVYGRFIAVDNNSGRESYLLSRQAQVRVTELVSHSLRVADTGVVQLTDTALTGIAPGRTEVQVLSPITGRVIGSREIRVGSDKVWVTRLHAAVISGLTLALQPDAHLQDGFTAITAVTPVLTAKYQEGLVDVWVELSEGSLLPLRELPPEHYGLRVRSLDPKVNLEVAEECEKRRTVLASTMVYVSVELSPSASPDPSNNTEDIAPSKEPGGKVYHKPALSKPSKNIHYPIATNTEPAEKKPLSEELPHADAAASSYDHYMAGGTHNTAREAAHHRYSKGHPAPLEVGMYVLLSFFGIAVVVFAASCIVYSWRGNVTRRPPPPSPMSTTDEEELTDSITNAHDWVWLGRATLERASGMGHPTRGGPEFVNLSDLNGNNQQNQQQPASDSAWQNARFTTNPLGMNDDLNSSGSCSLSTETDPLISECPPIGATFTRDSKGRRRVTFNNLSASSRNSVLNRPPIPPHRNIGVNAATNANLPAEMPPPVPPHGVNIIANPISNHKPTSKKNKQNAFFDQPKFVEVNADDFVRLRGVTRGRAGQIRRATILENPLLSAGAVAPDQENEPLPSQMMDYEQLLSYFSALKESNA
ncbi:hypothetical protein HAZT_HAZT006098 [Hyalella azteca]|uniref:Uncharacterized protein n=1 Tax=Hyalella azteca TaxID=294128 RepID=A0A6A0H000_HYAAZ|nr:hypothetical protein HAZT_HAZT006098 [Hyalella azteca]